MSIKRLHSKLKSAGTQELNRITNAFESEGRQINPLFQPIINHPVSDYKYEIEQIKNVNSKLGRTFERLNKHQLHAIFHPAQHTLLSAMVGSGKTTVLIAKIFYLHFIKQVPFEHMTVLTFTNKAAREIKERIASFTEDILPVRKEKLRYFGTFHAVARQILQEHTLLGNEGFKSGFLVMDEAEKSELFETITLRNNLNIKYQNQLKTRLKKHKETGEIKMGNMKTEDDFLQLIELFEKAKRSINAMDFDDLINLSNKLLQSKHTHIPRWIIVDEFQDCNKDQLQFIENLKNGQTNLFVVGDPNQSIYGWRGTVDHLFETVYSNWNAVWMELPLNYRSTENILSAAQSLLNRTNNALIATRQSGNTIELIRHFDDQQEAFYLREQMLTLQKENISLDNVAILFRTHQQINLIETVFTKAEIPFQLTKKTELQDNSAQAFLLKVLKIVINPHDQNTCLSLLFDKTFGLLKRTKKIIQSITEQKAGLNALQSCIQFIEQKKEKQASFILFLKQLENYSHNLNDLTTFNAQLLIENLAFKNVLHPTSIHHNNYIDSISAAWQEVQNYINKEGWGDSISILQIAIGQVVLENTFYINDRIKEKTNGVHLLTIHASKGLEFDKVYIAGANTGLIPLTQHRQNDQDLKEEKRLLFVAMTRSKNFLQISWHSQPTIRNVESEPSYFLNSIPDTLIDRKTPTSPPQQNSQKEDHDKWELNAIVKHKKYGLGTIIAIDENELICHFESVGNKAFFKAFAKVMLVKI